LDVPELVQVIFCGVHEFNRSPPFGAVTVIDFAFSSNGKINKRIKICFIK
jgi:hypothetical protein